MKKVRSLMAATIAATTLATAAPAVMAETEVGASVAIASAYLWRGFDLGNGSPAVSGDLVVSSGGAYGGVWVSSGDDTLGNEVDLFAGFGTEIGGLSVDLSVWNYIYPDQNDVSDDTFGDLTEIILTLGMGPVSFSYYDNVAGASGYEYYTLGAEAGAFSFTLGMHDNVDGDDPTHLDISYAYSDNLSFTVSKFIADEDGVDDDTQFVVSYSLPLK